MARRRFFVDEVRNGEAEILGEEARHLTRVLRVEAGQHYEISDNRQAWLAEIVTARKEHVVFQTIEKLPDEPPEVRVTLLAALIKFDHFEWLVEKATELGVERIIPVETIRSERGLERAAAKRIERWRRIVVESSQQCRRTFLPAVEEPVEFEAAIAAAAGFRFVLDEQAGARPLMKVLPEQPAITDTVALLVGPEGGWTGSEREQFIAAGWTAISLGRRILRAETAAMAALAVVASWWQADQFLRSE